MTKWKREGEGRGRGVERRGRPLIKGLTGPVGTTAWAFLPGPRACCGAIVCKFVRGFHA